MYYDIFQIFEEIKLQVFLELLICDIERLQIVMYDFLVIFDVIYVVIFGNGFRDCIEWYFLLVFRFMYSYGLFWLNMGFWVFFIG